MADVYYSSTVHNSAGSAAINTSRDPDPPRYIDIIPKQKTNPSTSPYAENNRSPQNSSNSMCRVFLIIIASLIICCAVGCVVMYLWTRQIGTNETPVEATADSRYPENIPTTISQCACPTCAGAPTFPAHVYTGCPPFWTHFQDNCYRFFGTSTNWDDAEAQCNEHFNGVYQGHLVSIHSKEESDFVFKLWHDSLIQSSQLSCTLYSNYRFCYQLASIFLGLNDMDQESVFVWTDGTPYDYNEWGPNQPSNWGGDEDCSHWIDPTIDDTTKPWNDFPCSDPFPLPFVCKLRLV